MPIQFSPVCALALWLCLTISGAVSPLQAAETAAGYGGAPPATEAKPYTHATEPLESCMAKWDPGTHMTKEAWRETCQRVSDERSDHLRKQGVLPERK